jgi:hypothetical protein
MNIFSSLKLNFNPKYEPSAMVSNKIRPGDTLMGRVLKVKERGMVLFDFNRTKAWAHVTFPVKEGEMIEVSVMENRPRLKLKVVDPTRTVFSQTGKTIPFSTFPTENTIHKLQSEIGKTIGPEGGLLKSKTLPTKISAGIEQLFSHFQHLDMGKRVSDLSFRLRSFIENSGIFFEKRVEKEIQNLYRSHTEISTRDLQQNQKIRNIIKSDLKPCLLILKHFIHESELKPQKGSTDNLQHLKPLINRMLENIGFQQTKSLEIQQGQKVSPDTVYTDPRKDAHPDIREMRKIAPKLHHFLKTQGHNLDKKVHFSILKVADTFELAFPRETALNPIIDETTRSNILKEDMPQHLKKLEEFFKHQATSANPLDPKELEDIKKLLSRVRAEIENWQGTGDGPKKAQKPETGQVITFSLPLPQEDGKGKLKIFYSKKRKNSTDEGFKMSLLLQMQNIGDVRTDFFLLKKQLKIAFYLNDHRLEKIIQAHTDSIKTSLAEHFERVLVNVVISERKVEDFDIEHLLTENNSLIDLRV